jgi:hypothetical protein
MLSDKREKTFTMPQNMTDILTLLAAGESESRRMGNIKRAHFPTPGAFLKKHEVAGEVTGEVTGEVMRLLNVCDGEKSRKELQGLLGLQHEDHFRKAYLLPALAAELLEMTRPTTPKSRMQRYRLTEKGGRYMASKG